MAGRSVDSNTQLEIRPKNHPKMSRNFSINSSKECKQLVALNSHPLNPQRCPAATRKRNLIYGQCSKLKIVAWSL